MTSRLLYRGHMPLELVNTTLKAPPTAMATPMAVVA